MIGEAYAFLASVLCGMFAVAVWCGAESIRNVFCVKGFVSAVLDILFWAVVSAVFCYFLWLTTNLQIRFFEFIGVGIGAFFCYITLGKCLNYIFTAFFSIFLKIIQFIFKILLTPCKFLYKILIVGKNVKKKKGTNNDRAEK